MVNLGSLLFSVGQALLGLGQKLYEAFTMEVDISFITKVMNFFGASVELPETISLYYILISGSAALIIGLAIYRAFK